MTLKDYITRSEFIGTMQNRVWIVDSQRKVSGKIIFELKIQFTCNDFKKYIIPKKTYKDS